MSVWTEGRILVDDRQRAILVCSMRNVGRYLVFSGGGILAILFICEWALQFAAYRMRSEAAAMRQPFYSFALVSSTGQPLSKKHGYLKLRVRGFLQYDNLPSQTTPNFTINSFGFRGKEVAEVKSGSRIAVVGGSTAFGTGLGSDEETVARQLERLIPDSEVINAAVIGYTSAQEMIQVLTRLTDLQPDLVISLNGWNDASYIGAPARACELGHCGFRQIENQLRLLYLLDHPNVALHTAYGLANALFPAFSSAVRTKIAADVAEPVQDLEQVAESYADNMEKTKDILRTHHARHFVFLQPDIKAMELAHSESTPKAGNWIDPGARPHIYNDFRAAVAKRMRRRNLAFVDLNDYPKNFVSSSFMDPIHPNAAGHHEIAQIMAGEIKARALLRKP